MQICATTVKSAKGSASCCAAIEEIFATRLFKILADVNRIAILGSLARAGSPVRVSEIAPCCAVDLSVVSRHLKALRDVGVVDSERRGREVYYRVRYRSLIESLRRMADAIEQCCPEGVECPQPGAKETGED